jgi:hypothetical protein
LGDGRSKICSAEEAQRYGLTEWCRERFESYARPRHYLFSDSLALEQLARNGLLADHANSFLFVCRKDAAEPAPILPVRWIARRYSNLRHPAYRTVTELTLKKRRPLILKQRTDASAEAPPSHRLAHHPPLEQACVERPESMAMAMVRSLRRHHDGEAAFQSRLREWRDYLSTHLPAGGDDVRGEALDCIPGNLVRSPGLAWQFIDCEWSWAEPIPIQWVLFRGLLDLWSAQPFLMDGSPEQSRQTFEQFAVRSFRLLEVALDRAMLDELWQRESLLQSLVGAAPSPLWAGQTPASTVSPSAVGSVGPLRVFSERPFAGRHTPQISERSPDDDSGRPTPESLHAQLFFDAGDGFSEDASVAVSISGVEEELQFTITGSGSIRALRFDPVNAPAILELREIRVESDGATTPSTIDLDRCHSNGSRLPTGDLHFDHADPQVLIPIETGTLPLRVWIGLRFLAVGPPVEFHLQRQELETLTTYTARLREELQDRTAQTQAQGSQLDLLRAQAADLDRMAQALREDLRQRIDQIRIQEAQLDQLRVQTADQERIAQAQREDLRRRLDQLSAQTAQLDQLRAQIAEQRRTTGAVLEERNTLAGELEAVRAELHGIVISASWRVASHLRTARHLLAPDGSRRLRTYVSVKAAYRVLRQDGPRVFLRRVRHLLRPAAAVDWRHLAQAQGSGQDSALIGAEIHTPAPTPVDLTRHPCGFAVYSSSRGNYFFHEIADLLTAAFRELGVPVERRTELDGYSPGAAWHLVIAPHEFFELGQGRELRERGRPDSLILLNTEQPSTQWFAVAAQTFQWAHQIWDMSPLAAEEIAARGYSVEYLPLGFVSGFSPFGELDDLPENYGTCFLEPHIRQRSYLHEPLDQRPIDVLFVGSLSPRRESFFAGAARDLARHRCYLHFWDPVEPAIPGHNTHMDTRTAVGLAQRSKIVLNVHRGTDSYFEWHRMVLHGMWQGALVVTEPCLEAPPFRPGLDFIEMPLHRLTDAVNQLLLTEDGKTRAQSVVSHAARTLRQDCRLPDRLRDLMGRLGAHAAAVFAAASR